MTSIAYYEADIQEFLLANEGAVLGALAMKHGFALEHQQKHAWQGQIQVLRRFLPKSITGRIYFEFSIPRMGKGFQESRLIVKCLLLFRISIISETRRLSEVIRRLIEW